MKRWGPEQLSIRVRLGAVMAIALLPVLALAAAQSSVAFRKEADARRASLASAGERSVTAARARLDSVVAVLETVGPGAAGPSCALRLRELKGRTPGVLGAVRLDRQGRPGCAASAFLASPGLAGTGWFRSLAAGAPSAIGPSSPPGAAPPATLLVAARVDDARGRFDGAVAALVALSSLRAEVDQFEPADTQVAIVDRQGRTLSGAGERAFGAMPADWARRADAEGAYVYYGRDRQGEPRVFAVAPLLSPELFSVLSAPSPGPFSWARLNLFSTVLFPLIAFFCALAAFWMAAERMIVRWLHYVQRVAGIYAKGRFTVRLLKAEKAPPEIRELAASLDAMAEMIVARDASLRESLAQKDALLREIHHRVKNNLQVISSLLSLQQRALSDPSARAAVSDTRQRIAAMALIYRALYQGPDLRRVELRSFLEELIAQLLVITEDPAGPIRTELDAEDLVIDPDKLAPLALFLVEAISNAQKHALAGGGGVLRVSFHVVGDEARLEIVDNGPGPGTETETEPSESEVCRTLMNAFSRQLHGRTEVAANAWGGVTARLSFPAPELKPAAAPVGRRAASGTARRLELSHQGPIHAGPPRLLPASPPPAGARLGSGRSGPPASGPRGPSARG